MCACVYTYVYLYVDIYTERKRESPREKPTLSFEYPHIGKLICTYKEVTWPSQDFKTSLIHKRMVNTLCKKLCLGQVLLLFLGRRKCNEWDLIRTHDTSHMTRDSAEIWGLFAPWLYIGVKLSYSLSSIASSIEEAHACILPSSHFMDKHTEVKDSTWAHKLSCKYFRSERQRFMRSWNNHLYSPIAK